ncbi:hypothetical protein DVA67_012685 [Solirubrobacter sp. CPCC 204708]|uniref:Uncharacterized protein n=1 Tax=Solirubrobacter deserti TaxID=2282478 RepID=A0ABT4RKT5_9ACTN|nr:hypothetical protein [Solirubrobacter deserti]MBE2316832.1 hypothetical protein [Solirubrobacter deserti]MDA0138951.1 hypothetical protein [Solirubrobacter deserti]
MVESVRWRRLRWRLRGAWQWPAFAVLTVGDALLVAWLPFQGEGGDPWGAALLAGFFNLLAIAVVAPFLGMALRRRRPDLPFMIARDYAGTALLVTIFAALLVGGLLHRSERAAQQNARVVSELAAREWLRDEEPRFAPITFVDTLELEPNRYRACAYIAADRDPICLFVNTDQHPPGLIRDTERLPNRR